VPLDPTLATVRGGMAAEPHTTAPPALAGLTDEEAGRRLAAAGPREPAVSSRSYKSIVRSNTLTLFNLILAVFFVLILAAGRPADGLFGGILISNAAIGIIQEVRAKRTLDRMALLVAPHARTMRSGHEREVPADGLVEGDLVVLRAGDQLLADGSVVESTGLLLDESPLTGESMPAARAAGDQAMSGSFVVEGAGRYVVQHTGEDSYASRIVGVAREFRYRRSPLELDINRLLRLLVAIMVPLGAAFVWVLVNRDVPFRPAAATATAGIVTLVPEGLILLTSLTFAVAAVRLARRGMLVQALNAVESLANVNTVCLDKTGTLTDGQLQLHEVVAFDGTDAAEAERLLGLYAASSRSRSDTLDAIAAALSADAAEVEAEVPFSSRWKWSALVLDSHPGTLLLGAASALCPADPPSAVDDNEREGRRALVFARTDERVAAPEGEPGPPPPAELIATVVLEERMRPDARETLDYLREQGVAVKVLSGDSPTTVQAVAARVGLPAGDRAWAGTDLPEDPAQLAAVAERDVVFARLTPEHKRRLIEALAGKGRYVAMIGDGVNDVPAMKAARLAIAFGSGSDLAKSTADAVLVTDAFAALPAAIAQGRQIIRNVQRVARLFVTKSVFAGIVIATFGLLTASFPLLPRHLSLAASVTIGAPGFVLALAPSSELPEQGSFLRRVARFSVPAGAVIAVAVMVAYLLERAIRSSSVTDARTAAVTVFVALGLFLLLAVDSDRMQASPSYAASVLALISVLAAGYLLVLGSSPGRDFFALARPGVADALVMAACSAGGMWLLARVGLSPFARAGRAARRERVP
jgi:cation-transporting P-type ATPase E